MGSYHTRKGAESIQVEQDESIKSRYVTRFRQELLEMSKNAIIVSLLSEQLKALLPQHDAKPEELGHAIEALLDRGKIHRPNPIAFVVKCSYIIIPKGSFAASGLRALHQEMTALDYLAEHVPDVPAPRQHGLLWISVYAILFMTYTPFKTLEKFGQS